MLRPENSPGNTTSIRTMVSPGSPIAGTKDACLIQIYPPGLGAGVRRILSDAPITIGRAHDCEIYVDDESTSRYHTRIDVCPDGYWVSDLDSTNGTYVNDAPATRHLLQNGDHLNVGNYIFRYLSGGNVENDYHEEIYRLTITDALTRVHNKRYLMESLERELGRSQRYKRSLALFIFDLDHFKRINDERGHVCGDHALCTLAGLAKTVVRESELLARYGGEEFVVVLPETSLEYAYEVAERLRRLVEQERFVFAGDPFQLTISIGVAATVGESPLTAAQLIEKADEKLYEAKRAGRNRVMA